MKSDKYHDGEVLVQLKSSSDINRLVSDYNAFGLKSIRTVSNRFNIYLVSFDQSRATNQSILHAIRHERSVVNAQNNHFIKLRDAEDVTPNDSLFGYQWSMDNFGQGGGKWDADIDATDAWDITTGGLTVFGDTIVVAIIDGGSDIFHEDLNHWTNYYEIPGNNIDDDSNGYIDDINGWNAYAHDGSIPFHQHGTHVGGIVGAIGNNDIGVSGVNWNVKILPVAGGSSNEAVVVEALSYVYVVRERYDQTNGQEGAFIVADNCSFGVNDGQPEDYPIWEAMYDSLGQLGILSIGATANRNSDVDSVGDIPTAFTTPYMIAVTNTNNDDEKSTNAAYGDTAIDLGAPGSAIISTLISSKYGYKSGTSMAAPHVAGSVALLMAAADSAFISSYKNNPSESILQIREYILNGVDTLDDLIGKTVTGGRLNLFNSINLLLDAPALNISSDSIFVELVMNDEVSESLFLSNTGGDTINYTISVENDPAWLALNQTEGSLPSLTQDEITLTFSSSADTGIFETTLIISADNIVTRYIPVIMFVYNDVSVGERFNDQLSVSVFPNPFTSQTNFTFDGASNHIYKLEIFDQFGKQVFSKLIKQNGQKNSISWNYNTSGVYFYRILTNRKQVSSGKLLHY